jgi:hypothetical protein
MVQLEDAVVASGGKRRHSLLSLAVSMPVRARPA